MEIFSLLSRNLQTEKIYFYSLASLPDEIHLHPEEEDLVLSCSSESRKVDILGSRFCASRVLQECGQKSASVLNGPSGEPLWPQGVCGSLAHTKGAWGACCAPNKEFRSLGIDIEPESRYVSKGAGIIICNPAELELSIPVLEVFCIKEAVFKALFPLVGKKFGFQAFSLQKTGAGEFSGVLTEPLSEDFKTGFRISGLIVRDHGFLLALVRII